MDNCDWDERNPFAGTPESWGEYYDSVPFYKNKPPKHREEFIKMKLAQAVGVEKLIAKEDEHEEKMWADFKNEWLQNNKEEDWEPFMEMVEGCVEYFWGDNEGTKH